MVRFDPGLDSRVKVSASGTPASGADTAMLACAACCSPAVAALSTKYAVPHWSSHSVLSAFAVLAKFFMREALRASAFLKADGLFLATSPAREAWLSSLVQFVG